MPRKKRQESPFGIYHWICRGIHKKDLFHRPAEYQVFKDLLSEYKDTYEIKIYHYCLMKNHVHLLIYSPSLDNMAKFSQIVQRRYAYYYCGAHKWVGNVFQRGYRSTPLDKESYLLECGRYIERNPLRAKIVSNPSEYPYSSFSFYGMGTPDKLIEASPAYLGLAQNDNDRMATYSEYVSETRIQEEMILAGKVPF